MIVATRNPLAYYEMSFSLSLDVDTAKLVERHNTVGWCNRLSVTRPKAHPAKGGKAPYLNPPLAHRKARDN